MSRNIKYTIENIEKVHTLVNNKNIPKNQAILKAGFSNASAYHNALRRLKLREEITITKDPEARLLGDLL